MRDGEGGVGEDIYAPFARCGEEVQVWGAWCADMVRECCCVCLNGLGVRVQNSVGGCAWFGGRGEVGWWRDAIIEDVVAVGENGRGGGRLDRYGDQSVVLVVVFVIS